MTKDSSQTLVGCTASLGGIIVVLSTITIAAMKSPALGVLVFGVWLVFLALVISIVSDRLHSKKLNG